ncbi:MAG: class I SAM-dependent methyltransferase [Acidobacteriaceae bacterium]|nr:class I SAM-dependent methyltransferase [Acidobacteriaceae bacterium]MBV9781846.1 class I SAM-dependent methyltransferase [Acidobacteriaceae bacterium]
MTSHVHSPRASATRITLKEKIKSRIPRYLLLTYQLFRTRDIFAVCSFLFRKHRNARFVQRWELVKRLFLITRHVTCYHSQSEIFAPIKAILALPPEVPGVIVEAGCCKGGSTAKLSLAAALAGRELVVFDSFEGIPDNSEPHDKNIWGGEVKFAEGDYAGTLEEVSGNVRRFGDIKVCRFVKGFFDSTMPDFREPVAVAYLDVDLASSTKTCLKHLWPQIPAGGTLFSQDGHLPLVLKVFADDAFWRHEVNTTKPAVLGFGESKVIACRK